MGNEGGTWIMYGVASDDPECLHTPEELIQYIEKIGFLPLFRNDIPGFSVEERTVPDFWWSGNVERDPWEWRAILARDDRVIYGKFFNKKAGFISRKWFPYFANYRRDGYDFDALWDDEKASNKQKRIMDWFEDEEAELYSFELKAQSGFGKGGEKNFDGVVTGLQMQMYLCLADFIQKKNKAGKCYGMAAAVYAKPEKKWGYEYVTSAYKEDPADSGKRIARYIHEIYPIATAEQIRKVIGVEDQEKVGKKKEEIQYPRNLLETIDINESSDQPIDYQNMSKDQLAGLEYALGMLKTPEPEILKLRYEEGLTFTAIAEKLGKSTSRIGQIHCKALRKMRHPSRSKWYIYGLEGYKERVSVQVEIIKAAGSQKTDYLGMSMGEYGLPYGISRKLEASGIQNIGELVYALKKPNWDRDIAGIGDASADCVVSKLLEKELIEETCPAVREYKERQKRRREYLASYYNGEAQIVHRTISRREADYPANLLEELRLDEVFGIEYDCHNLTQDQLDGVEAMLIAAGELGCWTKNIKKAHIPVTPEILHWYYRDGMRPWQIAEKIDKKDGLEEVRIWRSRIVRANIKYGIGLWAVKGASYRVNVNDFQKGSIARDRSLDHTTDLAATMGQMPEILTGSEWLKAHGVPEGYGKTETDSRDGVCILWRKDDPGIRW